MTPEVTLSVFYDSTSPQTRESKEMVQKTSLSETDSHRVLFCRILVPALQRLLNLQAILFLRRARESTHLTKLGQDDIGYHVGCKHPARIKHKAEDDHGPLTPNKKVYIYIYIDIYIYIFVK